MLREFLSDRRGNFLIITAVAIVPIMGALALSVDFAQMSRQRQDALNALDAAGIATARMISSGATDDDAKTFARTFFDANLGTVNPSDTTLTVVLPTDTSGGGILTLSASLNYRPYFFPTFASLLSKTAGGTQLSFSATSQVRLKDTLEVALVLDNSGSMDFTGSTGQKRITLLQEASKDLVDTLAAEAASLKQLPKPVQFGVVPFAASVNIGSQYASASWMDTDGISPIHHENFDWSTMPSSLAVTMSGGIYYKTGSGWGAQQGQKVTRFTMFNDLQRQTGTQQVQTGTTTQYQCTGYWYHRTCSYVTVPVYTSVPVYGSYASWQGCVEARPYPYNVNDTPASSGTPATMFVPMFAPDETDRRDSYNRGAYGNWWPDLTTSTNDVTRQNYMPKYFTAAPQGTAAASPGTGPNLMCTTTPITPLTDVTTAAGKTDDRQRHRRHGAERRNQCAAGNGLGLAGRFQRRAVHRWQARNRQGQPEGGDRADRRRQHLLHAVIAGL